jgi:O-methyltransferase involved in polyketide biosynthesis
MQAMVSYMGSRTKYFDDFFVAAATDGVRQSTNSGGGAGCSRVAVGLARGRAWSTRSINQRGSPILSGQL